MPIDTAMTPKFSHFHGLNGQLIGTLAYVEVDNQVTYSITKISPKAKRPTRSDGRKYALESKHIATVHREFFKHSISKKGKNELMQFLNLWLIATGKMCLVRKEIYGYSKG
jgi:hypothetical protein